MRVFCKSSYRCKPRVFSLTRLEYRFLSCSQYFFNVTKYWKYKLMAHWRDWMFGWLIMLVDIEWFGIHWRTCSHLSLANNRRPLRSGAVTDVSSLWQTTHAYYSQVQFNIGHVSKSIMILVINLWRAFESFDAKNANNGCRSWDSNSSPPKYESWELPLCQSERRICILTVLLLRWIIF